MKKILLGTSAIIAMAAMGASAHVRDGLVDTSPTNFELTITGEVSTYQAMTSISAEDADGNEVFDETYFGQDYSADIDFIAKTHIRDWEIEARVEVDFGSTDDKSAEADEIYMDFKHASIGTFRLGKGPAPSDMLSLEAALPGENWDDVAEAQSTLGVKYFEMLGTSRFADDANQIGYYSPKFGDMFQFGIAYIFNDPDESLNLDGLANRVDNDAVEVAAKFEKEFSGFDLGASGAYRYYFDDEDMAGALESKWTTGLKLGYMGFNWITTYGETSYRDVDSYDWGVRTALTYAWDRWEVGAAYERANKSQDTDVTHKAQLVELGASLQVFTGMSVHAAAAYAWAENDAEYEADAIQVRTGIDLTW